MTEVRPTAWEVGDRVSWVDGLATLTGRVVKVFDYLNGSQSTMIRVDDGFASRVTVAGASLREWHGADPGPLRHSGSR